jgi:molybdenum-dependent DNA-binding transcriptional regulator ModE
VDIPNYAATTFHKIVIAEGMTLQAAGQGVQLSYRTIWQNTAAINRINVVPGGGNLLTGSRVTLFGLS